MSLDDSSSSSSPGAVIAAFVTDGARASGLAVLRPRARDGFGGDRAARELTLYEFIDNESLALLSALLTRARPDTLLVCEGCAPPDSLAAVEATARDATDGDAAVQRSQRGAFTIAPGDAAAQLQRLHGAPVAHVEHMRQALRAASCIVARGSLLKPSSASSTASSSSPSAASSAPSSAAAAASGVSSAALPFLFEGGEEGAGGPEGSVRVVAGQLDGFMRLDASAARALMLFPSKLDGVAVPIAAAAEHGAAGLGAASAPAPAASPAGARGARSTALSPKNITSVHGLLSHHCSTRGGRRVLEAWVRQPLTDADAIVARQDLVTAFVRSATLRQGWREGLAVPDLDAIGARLMRGKAGLPDLIKLYHFARELAPVGARLRAYDGPRRLGRALVDAYAGAVERCASDFTQFVAMVDDFVEDPTAREPRINPKYSEALAELAETRAGIEEDVQRAVRAVRADNPEIADDVRLERDKQRGVVLRTKKSHEKAVRAVPHGSICQVLKDGIYFTTARLKALADKLLAVEREYAACQQEVLGEGMKIARSYLPVIEAASARVAEIDALASMATLAASAPGGYVRPRISDDGWRPAKLPASASAAAAAAAPPAEEAAAGAAAGAGAGADAGADEEEDEEALEPALVKRDRRRVRVVRARHPVAEFMEDMSFIANDYSMDCAPAEGAEGAAADAADAADAAGRFHIITGPNMGGKSTYIRTLGTLCLMMQVGSYVPAEAAELPVLDCVCARVGAGDSALKGVSTFMAEMLEAASILATATPRSLVIIDELGRGTSTYDGFGLAWSISEHLALRSRALALFATHYHELTALALELPRVVRNLHVTALAQDGGITMLFQVRPGACPSSFGIHVAESAAFPQSVLADARAKAAQLERTGSAAMEARARAGAAAKRARCEGGGGGEGAGAGADVGADAGADAAALKTPAAARSGGARALLAQLASDAGFPGLPADAKRARVAALLAGLD